MNGGGFGNIEGRDDKNVVIDVNPGILNFQCMEYIFYIIAWRS